MIVASTAVMLNTGGPIRAQGGPTNGNGALYVFGGDAPAIRLTSSAPGSGLGVFFVDNAQGKEVVSLGVDGRDQGDLHLRDRAGTDAIGFLVAPGGGGIGQIMRAKGDVSVEMGTKETGKGDVCVNGPKGNLWQGLFQSLLEARHDS